MKKPSAKDLSKKPTEIRCPACGGTGFALVTQPVQPGRKIYPAPCEKCNGKGRMAANETRAYLDLKDIVCSAADKNEATTVSDFAIAGAARHRPCGGASIGGVGGERIKRLSVSPDVRVSVHCGSGRTSRHVREVPARS